MRKIFLYSLTTAFLAFGAASPVLANERHERGGGWRGHEERHERGDWHWHGDIHRFHDYDFDMWRKGRWAYEGHEGREGWWWVTGGFWYLYPAPVFPYPDPYTPPNIVVEVVPAASPSYYYCGSPAGYYPYVAQCAVPWQRVVTATAAIPTVVQTPPLAPPSGTSPRDADYRQLNNYADVFYHTDPHDPQAGTKLKKLGRQVEAFRKSLYKKGYNAMDVLKDAEDLKERIATQRAALAKGKAVMPAPPSGSSVVFPPQ